MALPESRSPCCPEGSHGPAAPPAGYVTKGSMESIQDLQAYVVGTGSAAIIVGHDVFGIGSGRTQQICDDLAASLGVLVICPDFWHNSAAGGSECGEAIACLMSPTEPQSRWGIIGRTFSALWNGPAFISAIRGKKWEAVSKDLHDKILPMLRERGVLRIGLMGFCWGGWFVTHASSSDDFCCGASVHPSLEVCRLVGEDAKAVCEEVKCPQMLLPAGNDKHEVKDGGLASQVYKTKSFGANCVFTTFDSMLHGWVNRGNINDPNVAAGVGEAMDLLKGFYRKHLLMSDMQGAAPSALPQPSSSL